MIKKIVSGSAYFARHCKWELAAKKHVTGEQGQLQKVEHITLKA